MSRQEALKRLLIGIPFVPIYYFVIYPITLVIGIALAIPQIGWQLLTGRRIQIKSRIANRSWRYGSDNMDWVMSGEGEFRLLS